MDCHKRTLYISFIFLIGINTGITAQSICRSVLSAGGRSITNASGTLISTVGELNVNTYSSPTNYITEGFVQPFYFVAVFVPDLSTSNMTGLYPNPASDHIFISMPMNASSFIVEIYDTQGRKLERDNALNQVSNSIFMLDIASLAFGVYIVRLVDTHKNQSFNNIKLIKE